MKFSDIILAVVVILVILLIIIPLPTFMLDALLTINISVSLIILLICVFTKDILEFSVFPPLLLIVTIFRLGLNIASTRLILGNHGDAGEIIKTFGSFVIGANPVVGFIIFIIIVLIQFLVITKGSERVAEVAARFTLDAMPGKQMAIDADLNAGIIDEQQAKKRREAVQKQADFYGAMDGASKFVKGDAIMGIIILLVNSIGGIIIGVVMDKGVLNEVVSIYTLATVGDGLVSQIPALLISTATGIIVTKASSENFLGTQIVNQVVGQPFVMIIAGAVLAVLGLLPGMPWLIMYIVAGTLIFLGVSLMNSKKVTEEELVEQHVEQEAEETRKPENVVSLLQVDPIELEFGYGIIPLADVSQGGDLLDRVVMIRRQCAVDLGMIVPVIRLRDNIQFAPSQYVIKIKGSEVATGEVMLDHFLAMNPGYIETDIDGIDTVEPTYGLPAKWINSKQREKAELLGYTIVDTPSVIATHLTEIIRRHAFELLGRQQVQVLVDNLRQSQPALVDDVVPKMFSLGELQKILSNLLAEGVSIRDMVTILETLSDYGTITRDPEMLTEYVRQNLKRVITKKFVPDGRARVLTLDPNLEKLILDNIKRTEHGSYCALESDTIQNVFMSLKSAVERLANIGVAPIVLTSPVVRLHFKRMVEQMAPELVVLSYSELDNNVDIQADGMVSV